MMDAKLFIKRLFYFLIPFILALPLVEYGLSTIPNSYNKKKEYLEKQLDSTEVIITGNSYSAFGIDPSYLSLHGFNLSNVGQPMYYDKALTLAYLAKMPYLKQAIIPVCYFSFTSRASDSPEYWRAYFYGKFWHLKPRNSKPLDFLEYSYIKLYYPETMNYISSFFQVNLAKNLRANGFMIKDTVFDGFLDSVGARYHTDKFHSDEFRSLYNETTTDLEELVSALRKRNVKVSLITIPVMAEYLHYCDPGLFAKNRAFINSLCTKYDCTYHDYSGDRRFDKSDFGNYTHLNFRGAEKFTRILDRDLVAPAATP